MTDEPVTRESVTDEPVSGVETFESFDGVRIAYRDLGRGEATLLCHGFGSDAETNWLRPGIAEGIVDLGRRVVLIDARGHGHSDKPHDPESYGGAAMVRDASGLLDHLEIGDVDVVGYSMGSRVAIGLALSDPRVRSLVLGGVGARQVGVSNPAQEQRIAEAFEASDTSAITDRTALAFRNFADATHADRLALAAIQRAPSALPTGQVLRSIRVPTLVMNGEADTMTGRPEALAVAITGAEFLTVPGDHLSAVVKPEFRRAVLEFLRRRPRVSGKGKR